MHDDITNDDERKVDARRRPRRMSPLAVSLAGVALVAVAAWAVAFGLPEHGSASPGVAEAALASPTNATPSPTGTESMGSGRAGALAYARCMRAHGVLDFPDPNSQGGFAMSGDQLNPNSPLYQAAAEACKALEPSASFAPEDGQSQAEALKYSECMREHGISDFPDPNANGQIIIEAQAGSDLDPNNPQYQSAATACREYQPGGAEPIGGEQGGGS